MKKTVPSFDLQTQKNIDSWLQGDYDELSKKEIERLLQESPQEALDAFYTHLSFGTGGLRGIMGVGTNRMNSYTVGAATQGLANYINKQPKTTAKHAVLIGYDCRHHSREFAEEAAKVLAANGIEVFIYNELRPVALVSFGVLYKKCIAGIMITASHNPPNYNGYKVYWSYGGQVLPPQDQGIIDEVNRITTPKQVKKSSFDSPLIHTVHDEIDIAYLQTIHGLQLNPGTNHTKGRGLHVVYSSLHGGGITIVPRALKDWGFTQLTLVEEQAKPDGSFPTVKSPNPEEHASLALGIETMKRVKGDLFIATDPDADRLGIVVMHENEPVFLDGNQAACVLLEHICRSLKESRTMPKKPMFIKTIVTTELFKAIAEHYGATCLDVLTGFKYIGEKIAEWEVEQKKHAESAHHFIFGGEESYGYLLGTHARDKDAIVSTACACEAALQMKLQNKTLVDLLYEIYLTYGIYREKLLSLSFEGKEGQEKMHQMMTRLREHPPQLIGEKAVVTVEDYLNRTSLNLATGRKEPILLPKSDVIRLWLADETKIVVRPSGTEPKIKFYCAVKEKHHASDIHALKKLIARSDERLTELLAILKKSLL